MIMDHVNFSDFQIMDHVGMLYHFYSVYRPLHSMWSTPTALLATTEGQTGVPHPQAPGVKDARMFKVLAEISEEVRSGQRGESSLGISGRIRSPEMKSLLAKQLGMGLASLEGAGQLDLKTGRLTSKKQKKEKTPEQLALDELKKLSNKFLVSRLHYVRNVFFWDLHQLYFLSPSLPSRG